MTTASRSIRRTTAIALACALLGACSGNDDASSATINSPETPTPTTEPVEQDPPSNTDAEAPSTGSSVGEGGVAGADLIAAITLALDGAPAGCDPLDARHCLLPFPSNAYRHDGRISMPFDGMPSNESGVTVDPAEWNRNDGFSPNTPILAHIPDVDPAILPAWTDLAASLAGDSPVVLVDIATGERVPLWAELDAKAGDDADRLLAIHPAVALDEGATYAVGLRDFVDPSGEAIEPSDVFVAYRDRLTTDLPEIEDRRNSMEATFAALDAAGVERSDLLLAWDFTIATTENLSSRMLHIRDDALAQLGAGAPAFRIAGVTPGDEGSGIASLVEGTYTVPNYLTGDGGPGNRFAYGDGVTPTGDELPVQNGTVEVGFACIVSDTTLAGNEPAHLVQYGHGLLGSNLEIRAGNVRAFATEHNVVFCATKWAGMSEDDIGNAAATLAEFSNFPTMADRLQQGVLNQIFLGRLMIHDEGLVSDPVFSFADGSPLIDTAHLDYDGNSQGAIMGLMLTAVSPDIERSVLGVTGMNYSVLLERSVDFETYEAIMAPAYPNDLDRVLDHLARPDVVGSRRGSRLRAPRDRQPVSRYRRQGRVVARSTR